MKRLIATKNFHILVIDDDPEFATAIQYTLSSLLSLSEATFVKNGREGLDVLHKPDAAQALSEDVVAFVQKLRGMDLFKLPGVAETIDWTSALTQLDIVSLDPESIDSTLGALLKYQDDIARIQGSEAARILDQIRSEMASAAN